MTQREANYQVMNMCDFCENEFGNCGATPMFSYEIDVDKVKPSSLDSVIACNKYENPVTAVMMNSY
ncbi:MAG: hypothetical protein H8E32_13905 [Nitrospinae bacterium]|nr:hypothetical protein [Nitrospinota bacterium]